MNKREAARHIAKLHYEEISQNGTTTNNMPYEAGRLANMLEGLFNDPILMGALMTLEGRSEKKSGGQKNEG